jgi:hypothetical protein
LRVDDVDNRDTKPLNRPPGYAVGGFECGTVAFVSTQPGDPYRWVVHLAPPGARLQVVPISFSDPEGALRFLQQWVDERDAQARARSNGG